MSRARLGLGLAGVVLEAGCVWIWVISPRLTAIYNAEFTAQFFDRVTVVPQLLGPAVALDQGLDADEMVWRLLAGMALMSVGYVAALVVLASTGGPMRGWVYLVVGFAAAFRLTLATLPGLFSTDIFSYVMYGRIAAVHGQNPYVLAPSSFAADPFLAWVFPFWRDQPTVYGALWTDFSWLLSRLTGSLSNFDQVMTYRISLSAIELASLALLWWLLGKLEPEDGSERARLTAWVLYAWNPLVLFDLVGSAHNDVAMLALLLLGVALLLGNRGHAGGLVGLAVFALSALVKYATGVLALLWAVAWAAHASSRHARLLRLGAGPGVCLVLAISLWWPWLPTSEALLPLSDAAGGRLVINSAPDLVALAVADRILTPNGIDRETAQMAARFWTRAITRAVFIACLAWEVWRLSTSPTPRATLEASTRVLLLLPLLVLTWVWSWYFSWSLVPAALLGWRSGLTRLVVAYTLVALPVVYAHQYLNDRFSGAFVLLMAFGPVVTALAWRRWRNPSVDLLRRLR